MPPQAYSPGSDGRGPCSILVLNGPNLKNTGLRQPEIYGSTGLDHIPSLITKLMGENAKHIALTFYSSNCEGSLIDRLEQARAEGVHGVAFNAGAYTHTSLALADCIAWIGIPVVEVHISNVFAREEHLRRQSFMAAHVLGVISGFGLWSYALAVQALYTFITAENKT